MEKVVREPCPEYSHGHILCKSLPGLGTSYLQMEEHKRIFSQL